MEPRISKVRVCCPVCDSCKINISFSDSDHLMKKKNQYLRCSECGLLFISPFPNQKDLDKIYNLKINPIERNTNKLLFALNDNVFLHYTFHLFAKLVNRERADCVEKHQKNSTNNTVLDIGCGVGRFLEEMAKRNWNIIGQDVGKESIRLSNQRLKKYNVTFIDESLGKLRIPKSVNAVTFWHVFEHLISFQSTLRNISKKLSKNSIIILECPSAKALSTKLFGRLSTNVITPEHLTFWTEDSYKIILEKNNFKIINITYPRSFIFTSSSSAYKYAQNKKWGKVSTLCFLGIIALISIPVYLLFARSSESIRVCAVKK